MIPGRLYLKYYHGDAASKPVQYPPISQTGDLDVLGTSASTGYYGEVQQDHPVCLKSIVTLMEADSTALL